MTLAEIIQRLEKLRRPFNLDVGEVSEELGRIAMAHVWALYLDGQYEACVAEARMPHIGTGLNRNPRLFLCKGQALFEMGNYEQAFEAFREAWLLSQPAAGAGATPNTTAAVKKIEEWLARALAALPAEAALVKFPRTRHIYDAGGSGVGRDDLLMDMREVEQVFFSGQRVAVEEKVDGANLGLSIGHDGRILAQNRSHYVNSSTHTQFRMLDQWIEEHTSALYDVLGEQSGYILYGEWLYATHSIEYTRLPAYFLAFDIYDRKAGQFLSRAERDVRLRGTGIRTVPLIAERRFTCIDDVLELLDTRSKFADCHVEGVYLRVDNGRYLETRAKLVRADFIQGITDHWMTAQLRRNQIDYEAAEGE